MKNQLIEVGLGERIAEETLQQIEDLTDYELYEAMNLMADIRKEGWL